MKIGLVIPNISAYSETFFRNKILGLQQNGHEVLLFVNSSKSESSPLNCKVVNAPNLGGNRFSTTLHSCIQLSYAVFINPKKSLKLYQLNKKDGIPLVKNLKQIIANQFIISETLDWLHFGFGTMALGRENLAQTIGAKMAVSFRGFDIGVYPIKHPNCYERLWKKVTKIHVISDDIAKLVYTHGFKDEAPIVKITPAIDAQYFSTSNEKVFESPMQMVTVARLHWKKGLDYTLQALALLKQSGVSFEYRIIGTGPEEEALKFARYQLNLEEEVFFLGKLEHADVKHQLEKSHVYIQYSVQEGFCNAVLEAQAMGLLCVVSDAEGLSENVLNTKTGWVLPKRNPELLAQKLKDLIGLDALEKEAIRVRAVERVQREFTLEKQRRAFLEFYGME